MAQIEEYSYRVCEAYWCENEAEHQFETTEGKLIELCTLHHSMICPTTLW